MSTRIKRFPLQLKLSVALALIVMTPLGVAAYLVGELGRTAANVAASDASKRISAMEKAAHRYHDLVDTTKRLHAEVAKRLTARPELAALDPNADLEKVLQDEGLHAIALIRPDGNVIAEAEAALPGPTWRGLVTDEPIGTTGATLRVTFAVQDTVREDLKEIKDAIDGTRAVTQIQTALPNSYQTAFLVVLGIAGLVAASAGIWASTLVTRRITSLVAAARRVSDGHLETRVELRGADEMAELGSAFNTMLDDLDETRRQIEYLQRMGVWQDVARRLAHEIKNPLTPIQLAVQQCVSAYKGDDPRFKKLLADTGEIVEEEIEGLRRLVDTFRTLGALPKVEAAPLALAETIEELKLDPTMAARLTLEPPTTPLTVRADKLLLKRVLANLVENGIHAGQEAGNAGDVTVGWSSDARGELVAITVDDHGNGVTEANREKIFEPYVTTKSTGTGLGLAIARKIAIEHGGELEIAPDRAPTGGARFVVSLPLRGPEASLA
jgi:two-component system nitrogen regulation sensor histidine kinase NtrY